MVQHVPDTLQDALSSIRTAGGHAWSLFVSPHRDHSRHRRLVYHARAAAEESAVVFHVTRLSPLGVTVLIEMVQPLLKMLPAHRVLPALEALEKELRCFTVTDSVKDMSEPAVPLLLHARSWIPGGTYIAELHGRVKTYAAKKPERTWAHFEPAAEDHIAIVAGSTDEGKVGTRLDSAAEAFLEHLHPVDAARRQNLDPQWWGSHRSAQIVLAPTRLGALARQAITQASEYHDVPARALCTAPKSLEEAQ